MSKYLIAGSFVVNEDDLHFAGLEICVILPSSSHWKRGGVFMMGGIIFFTD